MRPLRLYELDIVAEVKHRAGVLAALEALKADRPAHAKRQQKAEKERCRVCGWVHDTSLTQFAIPGHDAISLRGVLPDIVRAVQQAHERGLAGLSSKDEALVKVVGGYRHPCKAFHDLKQREAYKALFDTSCRGFIALRGWRRKESKQIGT